MKRLDTADPAFEAAFVALLDESRETTARVDGAVAEIIAAVRTGGDAALCELTARFDRQTLTPDRLRVTTDEIDAATASIPPELAEALDLAAQRIEAFHRLQMPSDIRTQDAAGLTLGMRWTPLDAVGLYVPGGKAAYPSSVLMNAIPARVAGVGRIAMCVPSPGGALNPLVLAAARRTGVSEIYPATPMSRRPSARCSAASASTASPGRPRWWCWPIGRRTHAGSRWTCWRRPSTTSRRSRS